MKLAFHIATFAAKNGLTTPVFYAPNMTCMFSAVVFPKKCPAKHTASRDYTVKHKTAVAKLQQVCWRQIIAGARSQSGL
jgi:hypothetical protein